jgi:transposase-like protein
MSKKQRRHFDGSQKVAIVKRHLVDKVPVSDLCDEYQMHPTQFYQWQKQLFEHGAAAFERKRGKPRTDARDQKIARLESKLIDKNEVVAELLQEHVQLKKELGEL